MRKVIIFGTNDFVDMFYVYASRDKTYEICAFTADKRYIEEETRHGLPVVAFEDIEINFPPNEYDMMIGLGYNQMNNFRKLKFEEAKSKGYNIVGYQHPTAIVLADKIGEGNLIMEGVVIGNGCIIGDGNIISTSAMLGHNTILGNYNFFAGSSCLGGEVHVENNCMFGLNCTVKHGVKIADYTLVGAAAYISRDTEKESVYVPARSCKLERKSSLDLSI